ncbi:MAG: DUF3179 domain-containing (seleno)protein [Cyclobacteriaceae bacterium]
MKKLFYAGAVLLALFEILNVYFIMPMPGSQRMNSINWAYFLYTNRWIFRIVFTIVMLAGVRAAFSTARRWVPAVVLAALLAVVYMFNFVMTADHMFIQPATVAFDKAGETALNDSTVVIAVAHNSDIRAYPIRYIQYHHQVQDTVGGRRVIVTYCNVCRTGRVYEPLVKGQPERFRLVGMDHFNAMFEDETTRSWWRQVNGEAVTGPLRGEVLPEAESFQLTLGKLFQMYPQAQVMRADATFKEKYDTLGRFEKGRSKGQLTRTDSLSWQDKSWVVGVVKGDASKAFDWNELKRRRVLHDFLAGTPVAVVLSEDQQTFAAFERSSAEEAWELHADTVVVGDQRYNLRGESYAAGPSLTRLKSYQEFWHSWKTFHPDTEAAK